MCLLLSRRFVSADIIIMVIVYFGSSILIRKPIRPIVIFWLTALIALPFVTAFNRVSPDINNCNKSVRPTTEMTPIFGIEEFRKYANWTAVILSGHHRSGWNTPFLYVQNLHGFGAIVRLRQRTTIKGRGFQSRKSNEATGGVLPWTFMHRPR